MSTARVPPSERLPDETLTMWVVGAAGSAVVAWVACTAAANAVGGLQPWVSIAVAAAGVAYAAVVPRARLRRWRWALNDEELDIVHGVWRVRRTIVPLTRIQHVSVQRTAWTDAFGLVHLHVHTAAGETTIPALKRQQADDVRDRILEHLRTPDDL